MPNWPHTDFGLTLKTVLLLIEHFVFLSQLGQLHFVFCITLLYPALSVAALCCWSAVGSAVAPVSTAICTPTRFPFPAAEGFAGIVCVRCPVAGKDHRLNQVLAGYIALRNSSLLNLFLLT